MRVACLLFSLGLALALGGCILKAPPTREEINKNALPNLKAPEKWIEAAPAGASADAWLAGFGDAQLEGFVREALQHNPDLQIAAARVDQAAGFVKSAGATLYPQVNLLARGGGTLSGDSSGLEGIGLFINWELDLWGRVRAGRGAASSQYASTVLDREYARQSLAALVAKSWFLAIEARLQKELAEDMAMVANRQIGIAEERLRVGSGDQNDATLARASYASYRDSARSLEYAYRQSVRALEALAGRYPAGKLEVSPTLAPIPGPVPVGVPSELLERRPDVVAAERRIAAAFYRSEEAKAARLPRIALTAAGTTISSDLFVLQDRDNPVLSVGASLTAPLFLGGQLQAQVEVRTAEQKQALADYGRIGARAFGEVEGALAASVVAEEREQILRELVTENARALDFAQQRYRVGAGDQRAVQQQSLALSAARTALLRVQTERLVQRVNLHLALGGNFEARK